MSNESLNQKAWTKLFATHDILQVINAQGSISLSADQIKAVREPRLMTKFDHSYQLPKIFSENGISILPTSRGGYELGKFEIFSPWSEELDSELTYVNFPTHFESLDFDNITSESTAISCAFVAEIFDDFLQAKMIPTISGRMGSNRFDFNIKANGINHNLTVDRAQIEIDGGFEAENFFALVEAKNHIVNDFVIRQLYYPYRRWKAAIHKEVRNVFLTYTNGVFELREYEFTDLLGYNSIRLVKCKRYTSNNLLINVQSIVELITKTTNEDEPVDVPFPQADSFERVINLCELLVHDQFLTKDDITEKYGFDKRQTDYYTNACKYLGLIKKADMGFVLTETAKSILKQPLQLRQKSFIEQIIKRQVFRESLIQYFDGGNLPDSQQIMNNMKSAGVAISRSTLNRRASTVIAWINWIVSQINDE